MRHVPYLFVLGWMACASAGCAMIRGLDDYSVADRPAPVDAPLATIEVEAGRAPVAVAPTPDGGCQNNQQCLSLAARQRGARGTLPVPTVCVQATGTCELLLSEDCTRLHGDYANADAVVIGTLLSDDTTPSAFEQAAFLAASEIDANDSGLPGVGAGKAPRPLVVLGCSTGADVLRATRHLAETLRVPAIVGPTSGESVIDVTQQVSAKAGTLVMTPTSLASTITNLADSDLTWRGLPSDAQRAKLVIQQITDLEALLRTTRSLTTVKLGIVHSTDVLGTSARDAVSAKLILNGRFLNDAANAANVSIDAYQPGSGTAQGAIATRYATSFKPDIVFITSVDQVTEVIVPLEAALTAARVVAHPYYVLTDAAKSQQLLDSVASAALPADIKRRIRGVGVKPDPSSAPNLADFRAAFATRYGAAPDVATAVAYDATYAIAYSLAAAPTPPTGASVAHGLRTLAVGTPAATGAKGLAAVLTNLGGGKSIALRGSFGLMQWDSNGDITGGTVEVWCLGTVAAAPAFGSSGLTMDVQTQVVGGAFVQCQ